jgi:hypothetical protein
VFQEERSLFWAVIVSAIVGIKIHIKLCLILNRNRDRAVCIWRLSRLHFRLWGWMESEVYKRAVATRDGSPARSLYAAARTEKRDDPPRRATRELRTRVAECAGAGGGIFEHSL